MMRILPVALCASVALLAAGLLLVMAARVERVPGASSSAPPGSSTSVPRPANRVAPAPRVGPPFQPVRDDRQQFSRFQTLVTFGGEAVSGARVGAQVVRYDSLGGRDPEPLYAELVEPGEESGPDGSANGTVSYRESMAGDTECEVGAYHPRLGTAYAVARLGDLRTGVPVRLELQRRRAIRGRVVNGSGEPVAGMWVQINGLGLEKESIPSCHGMAARTGGDGTFLIPGIHAGNTPTSLVVVSAIQEFEITNDMFHAAEEAWEIGDLVIAPISKASLKGRILETR